MNIIQKDRFHETFQRSLFIIAIENFPIVKFIYCRYRVLSNKPFAVMLSRQNRQVRSNSAQ